MAVIEPLKKRSYLMFSRIDRVVHITALTACFLAVSPCLQASDDVTPARQPGEAVRALIISGRGHHDESTATAFLRRVLVGSGNFRADLRGPLRRDRSDARRL